jgi:hypothetical protein
MTYIKIARDDQLSGKQFGQVGHVDGMLHEFQQGFHLGAQLHLEIERRIQATLFPGSVEWEKQKRMPEVENV